MRMGAYRRVRGERKEAIPGRNPVGNDVFPAQASSEADCGPRIALTMTRSELQIAHHRFGGHAMLLFLFALLAPLAIGFAAVEFFNDDDDDDNGDDDGKPNKIDGSEFIEGTSQDDIITGAGGDDIINALAGDDVVNAGPNEDVIFGDEGNDILRGEENPDDIFGGPGADTLIGGGGADFLDGGEGNDILEGGPNADFLTGRSGDDILLGGRGFDILTGGRGDDVLEGGLQGDDLRGKEGDDILNGGEGPDDLEGGKGIDIVNGGFTLSANGTPLTDDGEPDVMTGGQDDDVIYVGERDVARGGPGGDTFIYTDLPADPDRGNDGIVADFDFDQGDRLVIYYDPANYDGDAPDIRFVSTDTGANVNVLLDGERVAKIAQTGANVGTPEDVELRAIS